jgi:phenylalanyl-tRNA synthetase beta chain
MKVLLSWLREFVDVPGSAEEIGATMSVRGFAVEGIDPTGDGDSVIDFEVTGNRPDCMSIAGMAREIATAYGVPLRDPAGRPSAGPAPHEPLATGEAGPADIDIIIDNPELCGCYVGAAANVSVAPSPAWLQARLKASGIRPISNIVDITNYVLLEMGQPMHAFDRTTLGGGRIRVRTARDGERLVTLDGQERLLSPDMLVIADAARPVAIAGVMGGGDSEVNEATTTIVFESAYFNPLSVRRTSRKLGLKTEASMRFERGIDPGLAKTALLRACALLAQVGAGTAGGPIVAGTLGGDTRTVALRRDRIAGFLGLRIPDADVTRILDSLGFVLDVTADGWSVGVPARRVDVAREVDLIEEVARHHGFDRIPATFPPLRVAPPRPDPQIARAHRTRHVMTGIGFSESVTFGFTSERSALPFVADPRLIVRIKNPLSEAFAVLRPSLLPGLIESVATNVRRGRPDVRLFEMGTRFLGVVGAQQAVAFVWTGAARHVHWSEKPRQVDFFDAKSVVGDLALAYGIEVDFGQGSRPFLTPGKTADLLPRPHGIRPNTPFAVVHRGGPLGFVGELSSSVTEAFGLPAGTPVYVGELDSGVLTQFEEPTLTVNAVPRFPGVVRDISVLLDEGIEAVTIRMTITEAAGDILEDVREFDRYQGKGVPEGQISLSLRLTFRSPDRTLTDAEVQLAMDKVLADLREKHGAVQR